MIKKILIVKNVSREGPGLLEEIFNEQKVLFDVVDLEGKQVFSSPRDYGALVVLGGPDSANDTTEKMQNELAKIKECLDSSIPYLGICLGMQALVKAAGGKVIKNPISEIGFRDPDGNLFEVELAQEGRADPLFSNLEPRFHVFHLHGETVELIKGIELLGTGKFCRNQIVKIGANAYGLQCHFELTPSMFEVWLNEDPDLLAKDRKELTEDFENIKNEYTSVGRTLFQNFIGIVERSS